jgi:integrase
MSADHSTPAPARDKPAKPTTDFPLFAHAAGVWAKKIRGKLYYFGPWDDPDGALARYNAQRDDLHAGRTPRPDPAATTVKDLCNTFLNLKQARVNHGELSPRTWVDYKDACDEVVSAFGKGRRLDDLRPDNFAALRDRLAQRCGPYRLAKIVSVIRSVFKYAYDAELIDRPMRFGPAFTRPSKKTFRLHRAKQGPKLFAAEEVRRMVGAAGQPLKAMLLLGINAGFGNADVGKLPLSALDLDRGWADYPRPKTGVARRCPLWPETVAALREALAKRRQPKDPADAGLVFLTRHGRGWGRNVNAVAVTQETRSLLDRLGINGHRNFYALRHTFRTIADGAKDQPAADHLMGHETASMASVYREGIDDTRLKAVTDHVRAWLFGGSVV